MNHHMIEGYAYGKLSEFIYELFVGLDPARKKLSDNLHFIAIISPSDFKQEKHQSLWSELQKRLLGKTKNIGLQRAPDERLTVHNKTLEFALKLIWSIYDECTNTP
jgi:hypothetical protein